MTCNRIALFVVWILLSLAFARNVAAEEIVNDITVKPGSGGEINLEIDFAVPVQYVRHFPQRKATSSSIYFTIPGNAPTSQWQMTHRVPPSDIVSDITVTTTDRGTGPKIQIEFSRPAEFTVSPGRNGQSLIVHITADMPPKNDGKGAAIPALVVPPVVAAMPPVPAVPVPSVTAVSAAPSGPAPAKASAPTSSAASAPAIAEASAPAGGPPPAPAGDVSAPALALPPLSGKLVQLPLGGKDGLPVFPAVEQVAPESVKAPPPEGLTPAQRMKRANDQAAVLMLKGGKDILAGQPFASTESFNGVLKLPPNRYTEDAQLWIGIAREKSGQLQKAILEFQTYLKLYPTGKSVAWVNNRLTVLKIAAPGAFADLAKPAPTAPAKVQNTPFQTMEFGSLGMYYYTGGSRFQTTGGTQAALPPMTRVDQKTLMTNVNMTMNTYNNEYDNRIVFQDFYARNFLPNQPRSNNRLGALFYEFRDRADGYSARIGRQSGLGGGVMGRFDGISAGVDVFSDYRLNVVGGQLADITLDSKPKFAGASIDFGIRDPFGGSLYGIAQKADGLVDRKAVGGNLRYFNPSYNLMSMFDYDTQFRALNIFTLQGAYNSGGAGTDYNFIIDRRRSPILDVRNAVNGTVTPVATLLQNGWTFQDLLQLADQRTGTTSSVQVGMINHLSEKWNIGTDVSVSKNSGLPASGTLLPNGAVGLEGFVPAIPPSPKMWTIAERLTGNGVFVAHDITNFSLSYSKAPTSSSESFMFSNHSDLKTDWGLDLTLQFTHQGDNFGGTVNDISPTSRLTYRVRNNFSVDGQLGLDLTRSSSAVFQTITTTYRYFASFGFQWNF